MYFGEDTRVRLNYDLTGYHKHLVVGSMGTLRKDGKASMWGSQDRFGMVQFDCCGHCIDVLFKSLDFIESPVRS